MAGTMEAIKEYLRLHCGVIWAPSACHILKTIKVQSYGDYLLYATPDDEMIARMLHLPSDKYKMHNKQSALSVTMHIPEYEIDNKTVYDILDQICKDADLYLYV